MPRRILITGGTGLLGPYLAGAADCRTQIRISGQRGGDRKCDLRNVADTCRLIDAEKPDVVINCCAYTDVDGCENEPAAAYSLNARTVENLTRALPRSSTLVQISTDQVYPDQPGPHSESDADPVNIYGKSKLEGEQAALAHSKSLVLRVNFFGPSMTAGRHSLSDWMTNGFRTNSPMTLFTDSLFSPLPMTTLAKTLFELLELKTTGIFNVGSRDGMSKHAFGLKLAKSFNFDTSSVSAGRAAAIAGRAIRPGDLRMDITRLEASLGRNMPTLCNEITELGRSQDP